MATYASIKYDMDLSSNATGAGGMTLLSTQTASSSANVTFDSGINSTYKSYVFKFFDIHPATDNVSFQVNFRDGGTNYDATKTTSYFRALHKEDGTGGSLGYRTGDDLAQSTSAQKLGGGQGNGNDEALSGMLELFDPSTTTFVKHFIARTNLYESDNHTVDNYIAGYCNVTAAIDGVQFTMSSGNIDAGTIKMYGVS